MVKSSRGRETFGLAAMLARLLGNKSLLLLSSGLLVGLFLADDYGLSWDEYYNETYARHTIEMYLGQRAPGDTVTDMRFYGPAFVVPWILIRNFFVRLLPGLGPADAGHFLYWLAFLPAPLLLYKLGVRYVGRRAALGSAFLFALQPVIFGHAFVNPKDIPFMSAFLASVWIGFTACDLSARGEPWPSLRHTVLETRQSIGRLRAVLRQAPIGTKVSMGILWIAFGLMVADLLMTHRLLQWTLLWVERAYAGRAPGPLQALFVWIAQDAWKTPLSSYLDKVKVFYLWARIPILIGGAALLVYVSSLALGTTISVGWFRRTRTWWMWILSAIALGVCSAVRVFGPFAGILVVLYALLRLRARAWRPAVLYGFTSALVLFAAWPSLWRSPLPHLQQAIFRMSRFPWEGRILYEGHVYSIGELPWHYVPRSILSQLTLPAIALGAFGVLLAILAVSRKSRGAGELVLVLMWIGLPLAIILILRVQIYSAFRQLMFALPALFLLGSLAMDRILRLSRSGVWPPLVIGLALTPSLVGIVRLHPYEMIYYNESVGGVQGAYGRYGLDTWGTTFREVVEYLNDVAPPNARVLVATSEHHTMTPFARPDLQIDTLTSARLQPPPAGVYVVDGGSLAGAEALYAVEREGIRLTVVQWLP